MEIEYQLLLFPLPWPLFTSFATVILHTVVYQVNNPLVATHCPPMFKSS